MRTCTCCGFQNVEEDARCPVCGTAELGKSSSAPAQQTAAPQLFAGRYRVDGLLGSGGMGHVFRVHDLTRKQDRALKILRTLVSEDPDPVKRFKREIGILSRIQHPAVLKIFEWGETNDRFFFVSELLEGCDLRTEISKRDPWPIEDAVRLVGHVAEALAATHNLGIVHRDIKPSNIMVCKDGSVKLLDFGLARDIGLGTTTVTKTGMILGTPAYMSPERFESRWIDSRSDLYSLGVVLFELLTGRLPFLGNTPLALSMMHRTALPPSPKSLRPEIPAWLDRLVIQCLQKDPIHRIATAELLAAELRKTREMSLRTQRLANGDTIIEDDSEMSEWPLVLRAPDEKTGWSAGMALRHKDRFYKLVEILPSTQWKPEWVYRFSSWPSREVLRRIVDYSEDSWQRNQERRSLGRRFREILKKAL